MWACDIFMEGTRNVLRPHLKYRTLEENNGIWYLHACMYAKTHKQIHIFIYLYIYIYWNVANYTITKLTMYFLTTLATKYTKVDLAQQFSSLLEEHGRMMPTYTWCQVYHFLGTKKQHKIPILWVRRSGRTQKTGQELCVDSGVLLTYCSVFVYRGAKHAMP